MNKHIKAIIVGLVLASLVALTSCHVRYHTPKRQVCIVGRTNYYTK